MTPKQHAELVGEQAKLETITKYLAGQKEHGGNLWDMGMEKLIKSAVEEAVDEGVYLRTLRQLFTELKSKAYELFIMLEEPKEERLDDDALELIDDIKLLLGL